MHCDYHDVEVTANGDPDGALACPRILHPSQPPGWNRGFEVYKEVFGEDAWNKYKYNSYPRPMPEDSLIERGKLTLLIDEARLGFGGDALRKGGRATHTQGVGARGVVTVVADPAFPEHPFFAAGRRFDCRLRHANASFDDDACATVRSCSLKFADSDFDSPLDLIMNSGGTGAFWNLESFMAFAKARIACDPPNNDWEAQKEWMKLRPMGLVGSVESIRIGPESYAEMTYYSKITFPFTARDGHPRFARFRIIPAGLERESGLPPIEVQRRIWDQTRAEDDKRPRDYLRREFKGRLAGGGLEYSLELQLHDGAPDKISHETFNMDHWWDEEKHPWLPLAHIQLAEALPDAETEKMRMWLGHQPPSLGVLRAYSIYDYRSLGFARAQVYPASQLGRRMSPRSHPHPDPIYPAEPKAE